MPDKKTCYVSDDSAGAVLTKFVANRAADLTSGTLYAAKATQVSYRHLYINWNTTDSLSVLLSKAVTCCQLPQCMCPNVIC